MKTCADCGGAITIVNADTMARDGWERWECGGCHRHLSFVVAPVVETPDIPMPTTTKATIDRIELPAEENQEDNV